MKKILVLAAALHATVATAAFKCVDEKGITHFGDTPPAACAAVVMYEVKPSGAIIRRIDPTPTADQVKLQREEADRKKESDRIIAEQKRKDIALVSTYASERELDVARDRNIEPIKARISTAQERLKTIEARERRIAEELEFYQAGKSKKAGGSDAPPPMLVQERERLAAEKQGLATSVASSEGEIAALKTRFEADKQRWVEIKSGVVAKPTQGPDGPKTVTLSAGAAGKARCGQKVYECPAGETYVCYEANAFGQRRAYKVNCVVER